jgi:hypothetical protein
LDRYESPLEPEFLGSLSAHAPEDARPAKDKDDAEHGEDEYGIGHRTPFRPILEWSSFDVTVEDIRSSGGVVLEPFEKIHSVRSHSVCSQDVDD